MKGKNKLIRLLTLVISVILLVSLFGTAATALADEGDDTGDGKSIPPGQMVRNGLTGPVVAVNVSSKYFLVQTNFGIVQVSTNQTVNASMIGQRVAVKLGKVEGGASMFAHNGTDNITGNVTGITINGTAAQFENLYKVATALQFRVIPSNGALKHKWGSIEPWDQGCVFIDEEGNEIPAQCGNASGNVIGLVGGSGNGTGANATLLLLHTQQMSRIRARIQLRLEQAEDEGDGKTRERLQNQLELFKEKQLRLEERKAEQAAVRAERAHKKGQN